MKLALLALALLLAGCPGGGGKAEPAPVEIDWPDAGVAPVTRTADAAPSPADAGPSGAPDAAR